MCCPGCLILESNPDSVRLEAGYEGHRAGEGLLDTMHLVTSAPGLLWR